MRAKTWLVVWLPAVSMAVSMAGCGGNERSRDVPVRFDRATCVAYCQQTYSGCKADSSGYVNDSRECKNRIKGACEIPDIRSACQEQLDQCTNTCN